MIYPNTMCRMSKLVLRAMALMLFAPGYAMAQTPVGSWRTFDDRTGLERGLVVVTEQSGVLTGRVASILDPKEATRVCEACTDARKNQPILGMTILTGLHRDGDDWDGGQILDPQTGSVYRCSMRLEDGGNRLVVRGYIGVSLFGRSQTWLRK